MFEQERSFYELDLPDWSYVKSLNVFSSRQDHFRTSKGWVVVVSKDYPIKGWHMSVASKTKELPKEIADQEAEKFFGVVGCPYIAALHSQLTGAWNYHEDIWQTGAQS